MRWIICLGIGIAGGAAVLAGCGEDRSRSGRQLPAAPAGGVSAEATIAVAAGYQRAADATAGLDAELIGPAAERVVARLAWTLSHRDMPWWWVDQRVEATVGPLHLPTVKTDRAEVPRAGEGLGVASMRAGIAPPNLANEGGPWAGGPTAAEPAEGWRVGFERQMWWRELPESWAARAGVLEPERPETAAGLTLSRPLGENLEASFGYHRTLGGPLDERMGMDERDEQSLFLQLGWRF